MSSDSQAIVVRDLKKVFRKRTGFLRPSIKEEWALKGISFEVGLHETYGMLGPNGSGKSTLIRILSTLLTADAGEVEMLGLSLPRDERRIRELIGRVSVDAAFYKKLSPRENLLYSARLYGIDPHEAEKRSLAILDRLGIKKRRFNDSLEEMSRGMQQKISIARAILINPPLLLLDEPTTGLDPKSRRDVQTYIEEVRAEQGTTVFLTTHDMAEAERLCSRIGFLAKGSLVAEGTADTLKAVAADNNLETAFIAATGEKLEDEEEEKGD